MRISDWSSDVCSSDLEPHAAIDGPARARIENLRGRAGDACNGDGRDVTLVGKVPALDIDRPVLSGIESGLEVQQRIGIDRQSVGVVGIIMARRDRTSGV